MPTPAPDIGAVSVDITGTGACAGTGAGGDDDVSAAVGGMVVVCVVDCESEPGADIIRAGLVEA